MYITVTAKKVEPVKYTTNVDEKTLRNERRKITVCRAYIFNKTQKNVHNNK